MESRRLEPSPGALPWEETKNGIRVRIPGRLDGWQSVQRALLGVILLAVTVGFFENAGVDLSSPVWWLVLLLLLGAQLLNALRFSWTFFGLITLCVDPDDMTIVRTWRRIALSSWSFPTRDIHDWCYLPPHHPRFSRIHQVSCLEFQAGRRTYHFASGIEEDEARQLFRKLRDVYRFRSDQRLAHAEAL